MYTVKQTKYNGYNFRLQVIQFPTQPHTGILCFFKVCFMPLSFTEDLHQYLLPTSKRNLKKWFAFTEKKKKNAIKAKTASSICFAASVLEAAHTLGNPAKLLLQEPHSASQHQITIALNCICICALWFCNASISKMCPQVIASSLYTISSSKRFHRKALFSHWLCVCVVGVGGQ